MLRRIRALIPSILMFAQVFLIVPITHAAPTTFTFSYTGGAQTWTVPAGTTSVTFDVRGAQGKNVVYSGCEALGGRVVGTLTVTSGTTLTIYVGGAATSNIGGYNGGGNGGNANGGGGGGASDIRNGSTKLVVAGGAGGTGNNGGCGSDIGGNGGGLTGGAVSNAGGGTSSAGGAGGTYAGYASGSSGSSGTGGAGASNTNGGGGGGGYYGGGGASWWGGGGGSSYTHPTLASSVTHTQGFQSGNGSIVITYSDADTTPPTFPSAESFSVAENTTSVGAITTSESATITIFGGEDQAKFSISKLTDSSTALSFLTAPNYEAPTDVGSNNTYVVVFRAVDSSLNAGYETVTVTVTDVLDTSGFNSFAITGSATYRTVVQINANLTVAAKVTFKVNGMRIPGCTNKLTSGSSPNITVSCSWKPSRRGAAVLSANAIPTGAGIAGSSATPINISVGNRTGTR